MPWADANQRFLLAELNRIRTALRCRTGESGATLAGESDATQGEPAVASAPSSLETISAAFRLSPFERDLLLLCAGIELLADFPALCASAAGDPARPYPTFGLALAALAEPHWSAIAPSSPLRYWRLIEVGTGGSLASAPLRIDEPILHYLAGIRQLDERLACIVAHCPAPTDVVRSHLALAERIALVWSRANQSAWPVAQLCGPDSAANLDVAACVCASLGLPLWKLEAAALPASSGEIDAFVRLWDRQVGLGLGALLLDCDSTGSEDHPRSAAVRRVVDRLRGPLILSRRERWQGAERPTFTLDVGRPTPGEQRAAWASVLRSLDDPTLDGAFERTLDRLTSQFDLSARAIRSATAEARVGAEATDHEALFGSVWDACRVQARPRLDDLAQRIEPTATWNDIVLPVAQRQLLAEMAAQVRQRNRVYEDWGFGAKGGRGLGISALFSGPSGTGKTMAAEVLAGELRLDLYRIDLSAVVSKYIGETEKNLRRIFDAAEAGGAILLFDEADALFGKRSEVRDSHDRYANVEISYLLQRMESYRGLAMLTTNMKNALDPAFLRRIRFVVQFPFPDAAQRAEIWMRIFPTATPTDGLDAFRLAQMNVPGGNIRNIALQAAFLAADAGEPVRMRHLLRAARSEYAKLERPLTETETAGWISPPAENGGRPWANE